MLPNHENHPVHERPESMYETLSYPAAGTEQLPGGNSAASAPEEENGKPPQPCQQHRPREMPVAPPARKRSLHSWWRRAASPKNRGQGETPSEAPSAGKGGRSPRAGMIFPIIILSGCYSPSSSKAVREMYVGCGSLYSCESLCEFCTF